MGAIGVKKNLAPNRTQAIFGVAHVQFAVCRQSGALCEYVLRMVMV